MLAKIDASENDIESLGRFQMKDYPILLYYFEDKSIPPIPYTGGRTDITMVDWIQKNTKYPWVCPWTLRVKKLEEQI